MSAFLGIVCVLAFFSILFCIAGLNLSIIAAFLRKRTMVELCLAIMLLCFLTAFAYGIQGPRQAFWINVFSCCFFLLPIISLGALLRFGKLDSKPMFNSSRLFKRLVILAFVPCVIGLFFSTMSLYCAIR